MYSNKKKVLHVVNNNALHGGIGKVLDYLNEGINSSEEFLSHTLLTSYDHKNLRPKPSHLRTDKQKEEITHDQLEDIISKYDVVHIHGIPHYGILENLNRIKKGEGKKPKIVNTAHSSVKQEFLAQYEYAKDSSEPKLKQDYNSLEFLKKNNILDNPSRFGETYWGSAIYRQEQIMSIADSVQHMNEVYKNDMINEYAAHANSHKHIVIPNGVKKIKNSENRPKKKRLMYVGRFARDKGIDELIESIPYILKEHPEAEIKLVGGDKSGKAVKQYKRKLKKVLKEFHKNDKSKIEKDSLRIYFTGWVDNTQELRQHYEWTDYIVIPSKAESFSLTASEALMYGRIPIMTRTKALDDLYISKGLGFGIEPHMRHGEGIAQTINEILNKDSSEEYDAMVHHGKKFVEENYSFEAMIQRQIETYQELLNIKKQKE